ncbi:hypothetical protein [Rhizobium sp. WYCCWR 11152]|uniref:hypothetical protein n=1 Tax=Rhizobium sp. WYCCWR 11152 TaxID=2692316 RepID=UPI001AEEC0EA|nr:hypothetical protein [Rhizobium sp. WYCCWR 11152]
MLVKTVTSVVATDSAGNPVDAIPVRNAVAGETDAAGRPVTPIPVTEDPLGVPVRVVVGKAAQNSAGQWVDTLPISGGVPAPTQRQLIASFTSVPNLAPITMNSGGSYTVNQMRVGHDVGRANCRNIRIQDVQFRVNPGAGTELSTPVATSTWRRALEIGSTTYVATYDGGAATKDLVAGGLIETDTIPTAVAAANSRIFVRGVRTVVDPTTGQINGVNMNAPASQGFRTVGGNQIAGNGAMNNSGSGGGNVVWPYLITGIPDIPMACGKVVGDSIGQYLNDTNTSTTGGFIKRGLQNVNGEVIPWQFQGVDANKMQLQTPTLAPLQQQGLELLTFVIMQCITNDINANHTLAQVKADFIEIATRVKTTIGPYGLPVLMIGLACLNRGPFTGAQNTVKNDYNNWLGAGADGYCDVYIDLRPYQGDTALYTDGIHPRSADHIAMATPFAAAMAPMLDPYYRPPGYVSLV